MPTKIYENTKVAAMLRSILIIAFCFILITITTGLNDAAKLLADHVKLGATAVLGIAVAVFFEMLKSPPPNNTKSRNEKQDHGQHNPQATSKKQISIIENELIASKEEYIRNQTVLIDKAQQAEFCKKEYEKLKAAALSYQAKKRAEIELLDEQICRLSDEKNEALGEANQYLRGRRAIMALIATAIGLAFASFVASVIYPPQKAGALFHMLSLIYGLGTVTLIIGIVMGWRNEGFRSAIQLSFLSTLLVGIISLLVISPYQLDDWFGASAHAINLFESLDSPIQLGIFVVLLRLVTLPITCCIACIIGRTAARWAYIIYNHQRT